MALCRAGWRVVYEETRPAPGPRRPATLRASCGGSATAGATAPCRRCGSTAARCSTPAPSGRFGRRGLPFLALFQVAAAAARAGGRHLLPSTALVFLGPHGDARSAWLGDARRCRLLTAAVAFRLDRETLRPLWALPLQQFVYRQLMYLVLIQSAVTALTGGRLRWQKLRRTGLEPAVRNGG